MIRTVIYVMISDACFAVIILCVTNVWIMPLLMEELDFANAILHMTGMPP